MMNVAKLPGGWRRLSGGHPMLHRALLALAVLLAILVRPAVAQQCLHGADESASERRRREDAIAFVARVNTAQRDALQAGGGYVPLAEAVRPGDVPLGFVPRLTVDQWSYVVSLKDLFDPCGFAVFSDQDGRIYEGRPVPDPPGAGSEPQSAPDAGPEAPPDARESTD